MGYRRAKPIYVLKFDDPELEGLEVRAKGASIGQLMKLMDLARFASGEKFQISDTRELDGLFELFASKLISWNLEDEDGTPVTFEPQMIKDPPDTTKFRLETDAEAKARVLRDQDMEFALDLVLAWIGAVIGVSAPLDQPSTDGTPLEVASIPMETLSPNL